MSLHLAIAGYIAHAGKFCTAPSLHEAIPGFTARQMRNAANHAVRTGWIKRVDTDGVWAVYGPGRMTQGEEPAPERAGQVPAVPASVWELAHFGLPGERKPRSDFATQEISEPD